MPEYLQQVRQPLGGPFAQANAINIARYVSHYNKKEPTRSSEPRCVWRVWHLCFWHLFDCRVYVLVGFCLLHFLFGCKEIGRHGAAAAQ